MRWRPGSLLSALVATAFAQSAFAVDVEQLTDAQIEAHRTILRKLEPSIVPKQQDGTAVLLSWDDLYEPLDPAERAFLDELRALRGASLGATSHYFGEPDQAADLVPVGSQFTQVEAVRLPAPGTPVAHPPAVGTRARSGIRTLLNPQYLPRQALEAYEAMMEAMQADLGRRLLVESGYRSPAYQLYLFLYYLPNHGYSIRETNRFVALPGHSEHGYPPRQAIDFINEEGINGEDHPEEFEALPEYRWLQEHARAFGFALSYPRDNPHRTAFEPWHWHVEAQ